MAEQELADRRIQREAVDAGAGRVDQHRRGAVQDVARSDLRRAALETVVERAPLPRRNLPVDAEDRPDGDVDVDVRRAVERVEDHDVVAGRELVGDRDERLVLLGRHARDEPGVIQGLVDDLVREHVELLHVLTVHVLFPRSAEDVDEAGLRHLPRDELRGERDLDEQARERPGRLRVQPLLVDEEAGDRHDVCVWHVSNIEPHARPGQRRRPASPTGVFGSRSVVTVKLPSRRARTVTVPARSVRWTSIPKRRRSARTSGAGCP